MSKIWDLDPEGRYCLNAFCGADDEHLQVSQDADGTITIYCFECGQAHEVAR